MLFARTTASAEFCIPVSIDIVRAVLSGNPNALGTKYPAVNPIVCVKTTERRMRAGRDNAPAETTLLPIHIEELFATTPPHIKDTSTTLAKGVHLETHLHSLGMYSFSITPNATGARTTFAHATHSAPPLTGTALPTMNFVNSGVIALARTVLHVVSNTLNATSAPAIRLTRFEAVPPGLHPTRTNPRKRCFPTCKACGSWYGRSSVRPMSDAESGMRRNWHMTPMGMEVRRVLDVSMSVKSDRSRVMPVPNMTPASMNDIQLPLFTQFNVLGTYDPRIADPNTNNGNNDVSLDNS